MAKNKFKKPEGAADKDKKIKTLEDVADDLRSGPGSYKKEKDAEKDTAKVNERVGAVSNFVTGKGKGAEKAARRYGAKEVKKGK